MASFRSRGTTERGGARTGGRRRRERIQPTEEWEQLALLCRWPEQLAYEEIRPLTPFGASVAERARETGAAQRWSAKSIAGYLRVHKATVHRVLRRRAEGRARGTGGPPSRAPARRAQGDAEGDGGGQETPTQPRPGEFRVHAALAQVSIHLSPRTCGRILALNRELYGLEKPKGPVRQKREVPFAASRRHQYWTADIRYLKGHKLGGRAYVVSVLANHSRAILSSAVTRSQDLASYLSVLYAAVERYGSPEALVTDGGGIFRARQARAVYEALGIAKHEIERGRPWQSYTETAFNVQRRMADWHFARAHERFVEDHNAQRHFAHPEREDRRRSPAPVLGFVVSGVRHREEELSRAFFSARFVRVLDYFGLRALQALEGLRRGGPGGQRGGAVARGREPQGGARRGAPLALRGQGRGCHREVEIGGAP